MIFETLLYFVVSTFLGIFIALVLNHIVEARNEREKARYYLTSLNTFLNAIENSTPNEMERFKRLLKKILNE